MFLLLRDKPINRISITELCREAGIHRSTFYLHYNDQYALMREIEEKTLNDVLFSFNRYLATVNYDDYRWLLQWFLEYVEAHESEYKVLLDAQKVPEYFWLFTEKVSGEVFLRFRNRKDIPEHLLVLGNIYWCTGILSVTYRWLMDEDRCSSEEMAVMLEQIIEISF